MLTDWLCTVNCLVCSERSRRKSAHLYTEILNNLRAQLNKKLSQQHNKLPFKFFLFSGGSYCYVPCILSKTNLHWAEDVEMDKA